jgi:hypothetical protein
MMADETKSGRLDANDRATRQEVADALGTTPDDPAVTEWINEHNSDVRLILREREAERAESQAPSATPTPAVDTFEDPFTGEAYTVPKVELGKLSTNEEQELRNLQERIDLARRGITPESFEDPKGIATPTREVQIGSTHVTTHEVVYPDRRLVTITDRVDADGDGTRTERLKDFGTDIDGVRETPLEAGLPSGPAVVVSGTQYGTPNFGPADDTKPAKPADLVDNSDVLDAIRPGGPTTDAGKALIDQFPDMSGVPMGANPGSSGQPSSGMTSPTSSTNPTSPNSPSPASGGGDQTDVNSPSDWPSNTGNSGSNNAGSNNSGSDNAGSDTPSMPGTSDSGTNEQPGVARVLSDETDSNGVRSVTWIDSDGNGWANDGTNPTYFVGKDTGGDLGLDDSPPSTPPPPPPPPADPPPEEDKDPKEEEDPEEEDPEEEEEEEEEGDDMVNPDADTGGGGVSVVDTGGGVLVPDYGSSTGAGVTNFGRGDLGLGGITGEIRTPNTAGPDVDPDADTGSSGLVGGDGTLVPDYGSSTGAGVTNFGRGDLVTGLGPIQPPTDDGTDPYASDAESFGGRGTAESEFGAEIGGFEQLGDAALDIEFGAGDFAASEQEATPGFDQPGDDMFD